MTRPKSKLNSRAARRQRSPSVDLQKTTEAISPRDDQTTTTKSYEILHMRHEAGITKRKAKPKPMSRQQRLRKEKGLERAVAVTEQLEKKVGASKGKSKIIKERAHDWDSVNTNSGSVVSRNAQSKSKKQKTKLILREADDAVADPKAALVRHELETPDGDTAMTVDTHLPHAEDVRREGDEVTT